MRYRARWWQLWRPRLRWQDHPAWQAYFDLTGYTSKEP